MSRLKPSQFTRRKLILVKINFAYFSSSLANDEQSTVNLFSLPLQHLCQLIVGFVWEVKTLKNILSLVSVNRSVQQLCHVPVRLFLRSFVSSFVRLFLHSFVRSSVCSFVRSSVCSFVRSFVCSFLRSIAPSAVLLLVHAVQSYFSI